MATSVNADIGGIPQFDCHGDPTSIGARWKKWRRAFEIFVEGKGVTEPAQKKALLLHCGGMQMQDIFFTFPTIDPQGDETAYIVALNQLDHYFTPQVNVPYERHLFRNISQQPSETIDQLITRFRQKEEFCGFNDSSGQIRDQVIEKCLSHNLRRKLLEKGRNLILDQLQTIATAMETSEKQAVRSIECSKPSAVLTQIDKPETGSVIVVEVQHTCRTQIRVLPKIKSVTSATRSDI